MFKGLKKVTLLLTMLISFLQGSQRKKKKFNLHKKKAKINKILQ